jgi:hypothetical protein
MFATMSPMKATDCAAGDAKHDAVLQFLSAYVLNRNPVTCSLTDSILGRKFYLIYGPPGTGKTQLIKGLCGSCGCIPIFIETTSFLLCVQGFPDKGFEDFLRRCFTKLCEDNPDMHFILFADEGEKLIEEGTSAAAILKRYLQKAQFPKNAFFFVATNTLDNLCPALKSRFGSGKIFWTMPEKVEVVIVYMKDILSHRHHTTPKEVRTFYDILEALKERNEAQYDEYFERVAKFVQEADFRVWDDAITTLTCDEEIGVMKNEMKGLLKKGFLVDFLVEKTLDSFSSK